MNPVGETLVGREPELERIDSTLAALDAEQTACLAIEGEPGIGKSRLVAELRSRAEERGGIVLHSQAAEFEQDRPFGVLVEALDPYLRAQLDESDAAVPDTLREELGGIFPSLTADEEPEATVGDERYRSHR